ncbi:MAG: Vgb family protein [Candidatus Geothermincolia bacterium]
MKSTRTRRFRFIAALLGTLIAATLLGLTTLPAGATTITNTWPIPTATANAIKMTQGPDGNMWFAEYGTGKLAKITQAGVITEYPVGGASDGLFDVASGPDGYVWFTMMTANLVGKIKPDGTGARFWAEPAGSYPTCITAGPDGAMWFTDGLSSKVCRITTTGAVTRFDTLTGGAQPGGIAVGADGALWFTEYYANLIGRVTTAGAMSEHGIVPTAGNQVSNITAGSDGAVWFNEIGANKIGRMTMAGVPSDYPIPTASANPDSLVLGSDGAVWFTEYTTSKIGRISPSGSVLEFSTGSATGPRGVGAGTDNTVWFTTYSDFVGRMDIGTPTWYLAEGSNAWGFQTSIYIQNPNPSTVHVQTDYMNPSGEVFPSTLIIAPHSQFEVNVIDVVGSQDFSTRLECLEGKSIAVDRTMTWQGPHSAWPEAHSSIGVTSPSKTWYLAEGSANWGFECWLLIENPGVTAATCEVTYMIEGEEPRSIPKTVPAHSRRSFNMADDIGANDASIKVESNTPVIAERSMYRNDRREGHDSIGTTAPSLGYYLAEGTTAWGFTTYVLVQNPNPAPNIVRLTYMTPTGSRTEPEFVMEPNSRKTIRVNDEMPDTDVSTQVVGSLPLIAERAMYFMSPAGESCHDSIGLPAPHKTFYLPDGSSNPGTETWTLVQNPNSTPVNVTLTYMTLEGTGNRTRTDTIPANTRRTYLSSDTISVNAAIQVTCNTPGRKIMVERSMYWFSRAAATDTIGGFSDL